MDGVAHVGHALRERLLAARARTLASTATLVGDRLLGPRSAILNPPLWEIGHIGWFQELWCLRHRANAGLAPSQLADADRLYDSAAVAHDTRWDLALPDIAATHHYIAQVLDRVLTRLEHEGRDAALEYFAQLAAFHEDMHAEAFSFARQTLAYEAPAPAPTAGGGTQAWPGDVHVQGGRFMQGASAGPAFIFDNEKWGHEVDVAPFRIARAPVTNADFAQFVEDGGYRTRTCWSEVGWQWRVSARADAPVYWKREDGGWRERAYDRLAPLAPHQPVMHVNWYEAEAWCRWAGRRLPTEAEWEFAASTVPGDAGVKRRYAWGDVPPDPATAQLYFGYCGRLDVAACAAGDSGWGCRQMLGNVWEWTADWFLPYPGFTADPYKEYSAPWFGNHKVLRGGSHATSPQLITTTYRNFYTPDRRDMYAGFRTCALRP